MTLRIFCFLDTHKTKCLLLLAFVSLLFLSVICITEAAQAQTMECGLGNFVPETKGSTNEKAFRRALKWSTKYWKQLIHSVLKVWCTVLSEYDIPCNG